MAEWEGRGDQNSDNIAEEPNVFLSCEKYKGLWTEALLMTMSSTCPSAPSQPTQVGDSGGGSSGQAVLPGAGGLVWPDLGGAVWTVGRRLQRKVRTRI